VSSIRTSLPRGLAGGLPSFRIERAREGGREGGSNDAPPSGEADRGDRARGLATYRADNDGAVPWSIRGSGDLPGCLLRIRIDGGSSREIAESLYGSLDQRFVVSAAGSAFSGRRWDVAVKNRFESERDLSDA